MERAFILLDKKKEAVCQEISDTVLETEPDYREGMHDWFDG